MRGSYFITGNPGAWCNIFYERDARAHPPTDLSLHFLGGGKLAENSLGSRAFVRFVRSSRFYFIFFPVSNIYCVDTVIVIIVATAIAVEGDNNCYGSNYFFV